MDKRNIFLASKSPRRLEILKSMGYEVILLDSDYEEDNGLDMSPLDLARKHAEGKARGALKSLCGKEGIVLGADTFVFLDGKVIGKPEDKDDARRMLKRMSGKTHEVISGVCVMDSRTKEFQVETDVTKVTFIDISDEVLEKYIEVADYMDKAGAYAIQAEASIFVEKIEGSYTNIIGLPKELTAKMLDGFHI